MGRTLEGARFVFGVCDENKRGAHAKSQSREGKADMSVYLLGSVTDQAERLIVIAVCEPSQTNARNCEETRYARDRTASIR